jgi:SAM-dependent methyltransferase
MSFNLLDRFPFDDGEFDLVYSSHFIEHIRKEHLRSFFDECFRILKPQGILRLVTPDLEKLCELYLKELAENNLGNAQYLVFEILDQCVRQTSGGDVRYWDKKAMESVEFGEFMVKISGRSLRQSTDSEFTKSSKAILKPYKAAIFARKISSAAKWTYSRVVTSLLPAWFKNSNVSFARPGELHKWLYDFPTLKQFLEEANFATVIKCSHNRTHFPDDKILFLDCKEDGSPRKGVTSLYLEAFRD